MIKDDMFTKEPSKYTERGGISDKALELMREAEAKLNEALEELGNHVYGEVIEEARDMVSGEIYDYTELSTINDAIPPEDRFYRPDENYDNIMPNEWD